MARKTDIRELPDGELLDALDEAKKELFNLRFQLATGQLDNTARMGDARRHVARVKTELRAREIAAHEALVDERENA
ncbi:MAG TPA: 50S ribosomal protein L29 [Acidimicrobiales bacterium]|jgi:large subunit ribosomal protein L29|nr:50S ribosomal protein L29 [Acidimicrobiales bacterium]